MSVVVKNLVNETPAKSRKQSIARYVVGPFVSIYSTPPIAEFWDLGIHSTLGIGIILAFVGHELTIEIMRWWPLFFRKLLSASSSAFITLAENWIKSKSPKDGNE